MSEKPHDMTELLPTGLTQPEVEYVYNVEVLGMPNRVAAQQAGMPLAMTTRPHILQARDLAKKELRGHLSITKEDVVFGIREAIGRAQILAEPMTEIVGWEKIAKLLGYDAPQKVDVNIIASVEVLKGQVRNLSDAELVRLVADRTAIDGDFYRVEDDKKDAA